MTPRIGFSLQGRGALAGREAITTLARRAEALGFDSIFVTDRLLIPVRSASPYPYSATGAFPLGPDEPWLEALTAVTYLATVTERIAVGTSVLVIPYRNPVFTARALATADYLSGGRVILGAGIGWWREEFDGLGVRFEERAARTVELAVHLADGIRASRAGQGAGPGWAIADDYRAGAIRRRSASAAFRASSAFFCTGSQRSLIFRWSSLKPGLPTPVGPIQTAASRYGSGTSTLYCASLVTPLSFVYRYCAAAGMATTAPNPSAMTSNLSIVVPLGRSGASPQLSGRGN